MAIRYYDESLVEKIKKWVKDPNMKILGPNESSRLFQLKADLNDDKPLTLPLIAISRDSEIEIINTNKHALTYDGAHVEVDEEKSKQLNAIPIRLSYQLDVYSKYYEEVDEYIRNFVFNIINYPKLSIEIPYNDSKIVHDSTIQLESTITDSSDIPERLIAGQFTRMSLKLFIDDAYLFSVPFMKNWKISTGKIQINDEKENLN